MLQIPDADQLPMGLIVRHLPARVQATIEEGPGGKTWRWEFRTAVSAMAESTIVGFAAFRWDGERWVARHPAGTFLGVGDFAEWYDAPDGKLPAGAEFADATNFCTAAALAPERVKWVYVAETASGRRVKGEAVVELLAELEEHAETSDTPAGQLVAAAALFRKTMLQHTGRALDYDEAAVRWLDGYVERNREMLRTNSGAFNTAGAFLGECLRRVHGGQWVANVNGEQWGLQIDEKLVVFPFNKLYKHIVDEHGGGDSLIGLFQSIAPMMAVNAGKVKHVSAAPPPRQAAARDEGDERDDPPMAPPKPYEPPKPAWKFWKK